MRLAQSNDSNVYEVCMSNKSFFAKREERFSSAQALFKHLGQLQRLQLDTIS